MQKKRSDAIEAGEKYYFTGKECKRGHVSHRLTITGACYECLRERRIKERDEFRERLASKGAS